MIFRDGIIDNKRYDSAGRERTKQEIEIIELSDSVTAHREWLGHLENLIHDVAVVVRADCVLASKYILVNELDHCISKYAREMENL